MKHFKFLLLVGVVLVGTACQKKINHDYQGHWLRTDMPLETQIAQIFIDEKNGLYYLNENVLLERDTSKPLGSIESGFIRLGTEDGKPYLVSDNDYAFFELFDEKQTLKFSDRVYTRLTNAEAQKLFKKHKK